MGDVMDGMDILLLTTVAFMFAMGLLGCLWCFCVIESEIEMRNYIIEMAKRKGIKVDPEKLHPREVQSPHINENCSIMVPDVGIIL